MRRRLHNLSPGITLLMVALGSLVWAILHGTGGPGRDSARGVPDPTRSSALLQGARITNDGQISSVVVSLRDHEGRPIAGARVRLQPSATFMTAARGRTNASGRVLLSTTVRPDARHESPSSGQVHLAVLDNTGRALLPQPPPLTVYNRVAVLLQGIGTSLQCHDRACLQGMFLPLVKSVLTPLGYQAASAIPTILEYSYQGGAMAVDRGAWIWEPRAYDTCDTAQSVAQSAQILRKMLLVYRARYPYSTFELLGHSLGGLVAMQAIGYRSFWQQIGPLAVDKLVTVDSPVNGINQVHALSWVVDALSGVWHLHACTGQRFGLDLVDELAGLGDHTPARQHAWAAAARAGGTDVLTVTNQHDLPVPDSSAIIDAGQPVSVVDRIRFSVPPLSSLGHSSLLYPDQMGVIANPDWQAFTGTLRAYLAQPCRAFAPPGAGCRYPSINRGL